MGGRGESEDRETVDTELPSMETSFAESRLPIEFESRLSAADVRRILAPTTGERVPTNRGRFLRMAQGHRRTAVPMADGEEKAG
jgi:hypothetical protein